MFLAGSFNEKKVKHLDGLSLFNVWNFFPYQNWYDARASCAGRGGSLARIYTFEENQMVGNLGPVSQKLSCGTV